MAIRQNIRATSAVLNKEKLQEIKFSSIHGARLKAVYACFLYALDMSQMYEMEDFIIVMDKDQYINFPANLALEVVRHYG